MHRNRLILLTLLLAIAVPMTAWGEPLVISEFMAKNDTGLEDEDGDTSDWIELCNISLDTIDLAGWSLTDDPEELDKWVFPSIEIQPGQSMIIFASDKDRTDPDDPLHTNFKLSGDGEYLGLIDSQETIVHEYAPEFPPQQDDISYGLIADISQAVLLPWQSDARAHVPISGNSLDWLNIDFDDSDWQSGLTGIGFDTSDDFDPYIGTNIQDAMYGVNASVFIRIPFEWTPEAMAGLPLTLQMHYEDGFVCWLNGIPVAMDNAPPLDELTWSSQATSGRNHQAALTPEPFSLDDYSNLLEPGLNVLCIQALNDDITSPDLLMLPELHGMQGAYLDQASYLSGSTPGAINLATGIGLGPEIKSQEHEPASPAPGQTITISCDVEPGDADIESVALVVRRGFEAESTPLEMFQESQDTWTTTIPGGDPGDIIRWHVLATDTEGDTSRHPGFFDPFNAPEYVGVHVDNPVDTELDLIRLFVEDTEAMDNSGGTRCIVIHDGLLYDNVLVRPRGQSSLSWPKQSYKLDFNSGHHIPFLDGGDAQEELNLQSNYSDKTSLRRQMTWDLYEFAGVTGSKATPVRLHLNGEFHSLSTYCEQPDERMLNRVGLDDDGALYKMYNIANSHFFNVEKKTRTHENNNDLFVFIEGFHETDPELLRQFLLDTLDVPAVLSYLAINCIVHHNDHIGKNYYLYRDTEGDREWQFIPWDKDLTFGRTGIPGKGLLNDTLLADYDPNSHPLFGDEAHPKFSGKWNHLIDAIYRVPQLQEMYLRHLRTQMDRFLQPPGTPGPERFIEAHLDELRAIAGPEIALDHAAWPFQWGEPQTVDEAIEHLKQDYLEIRRTHLYITHAELGGLIPAQQMAHPDISFGMILAQPPSGDADEEYIELINNEATPIDLTGWRLEGDVTFTFASGSVLPANGHAYVSPDVLTFRSRSESPKGGEGHLVLGPYNGHIAGNPCQSMQLLNAEETVIDSWCSGLMGDANDDGVVDVNDILLIFADWGCQGICAGDVNGDQQVNSNDILMVIAHWS